MSHGASTDQIAKMKLHLPKGVLQNWANQNPLDFHSIHWEALKESGQAMREGWRSSRDTESCDSPQSCCSCWANESFSLGFSRNFGDWFGKRSSKSSLFLPFANFGTIFSPFVMCHICSPLMSIHYSKLENYSGWLQHRGAQTSPDQTWQLLFHCCVRETALCPPCTSRHYFQLFPGDLKPLFTSGVLVIGNNFLRASSHGDVLEATP